MTLIAMVLPILAAVLVALLIGTIVVKAANKATSAA